MSSDPPAGINNGDAAVKARVKAVLDLIDEAMRKPANQLKGEVDIVENRLVDLRDQLIASLRRSQPQPFVQSPALTTINTALSLVVSIEYPGAGIHREALVEARDLLDKFFAA